jgi:hypothetical protein
MVTILARLQECTLLLLQAALPAALDRYAEFTRTLVETFGNDKWWIVCRADVRMRSEHTARIRPSLLQQPLVGFDPLKPWGYVYLTSTQDDRFWNEEVRTPALFLVRRTRCSPCAPAELPPRALPDPAPRQAGPDRSRPRRQGGVGGAGRRSLQ